ATIRYAGIDDIDLLPWEVDYNPTRYQKPLLRDLSEPSKRVLNTADDPFAGGVMVDRTRKTLVLVKPVLNWDPVMSDEYNDTLNLLPFLQGRHPPGFAPQTCKLTIGETRLPFPGNQTYFWRVRAEIDIDRRGWQSKPLNAGYHQKLTVLGVPTRQKIILPGGLTPSSPVPLDADGKYLPPGAGDPLYLEFNGYEVKDWTLLNLEYVG